MSHLQVAVSTGGAVFSWGTGLWGVLGLGDTAVRLLPAEIDSVFGDDGVVMVACGRSHTAAVAADGSLYTWGDGQYGQLGRANLPSSHSTVPRLVDAFADEGVHMVACGNFHTLAVTQTGALYTCGCGERGRLGLGDGIDRHTFEQIPPHKFEGARVVTAAAGHEFSAAVTDDGAPACRPPCQRCHSVQGCICDPS